MDDKFEIMRDLATYEINYAAQEWRAGENTMMT